MKTTYTFSVIRYVHDVVGGEFVNVGVVLYAPDLNFLRAKCTQNYARLTHLFNEVNGRHFRKIMTHIQGETRSYERRFGGLELEVKPSTLQPILARIFPIDDSSIQFSDLGGGVTTQPEKALDELYQRYVARYQESAARTTRRDSDVWTTYSRPLAKLGVLSYLKQHTVQGDDFAYDFDFAWKNENWRILQPLSFDLADAAQIRDKANRWLGESINIHDADNNLVLYFLLGAPRERRLQSAYDKAENILHKGPLKKEFIREDASEEFAENMRQEVLAHRR